MSFGMPVASTGALGGYPAIQLHLGTQEGRPLGPGLDFEEIGTAFRKFSKNLFSDNICVFSCLFPANVF